MILVVDDDPKFLEEARLRLDAGRGVFLAANAAQARSLIATVGTVFSLAVVDLDLRGQNGFDLIRDLHANYPDLPIVAVSGVFQRDVLETAKLVGAVEVLQKPIDPDWIPVLNRARAAITKD